MNPKMGPFKTLLKIDIKDYKEKITFKDFTIERISLQQQCNIFDLESFDLDENKKVKSWKPKTIEGRRTPEFLENYSKEEVDELIGSEFYLYTATFEDAATIIDAFRLFKPGYIVATYSESLNYKFAQYHYPRFIKVHRAGLSKIEVNEISEIENLYQALKKLKDKKLDLNLDRFKENPKHYYHAFINLVGILESLLTGNNNGELKYRFALNTTYLLKKVIKSEIEIDFNEIKKIYDIRSSLVHTGESKKFSKDHYLLLRKITQEILVWFVYNPSYDVEEQIMITLFKDN